MAGFMSAEHVAAMNDVLAGSESVRSAAAGLDRDYVIAYELAEGRDGGTEYWQVRLGPGGVSFDLRPAADAELVFRGKWRAMVAAARAGREGRSVDPDVAMSGDPAVLATIGPVFALAQQVATLPVDWPDLEEV